MTIQEAALNYARGEQLEMIAILAVAIPAFALGAWFFFSGVPWYRGLGVALLLFGVLFTSASAPLLVRDSERVPQLLEQLETAPAQAAAAEAERIDKVIANYPMYRWLWAGLMVLAAGLIVFSHQNFANGLATGLCLIACAGMVIDSASEARAKTYRPALVLNHSPSG